MLLIDQWHCLALTYHDLFAAICPFLYLCFLLRKGTDKIEGDNCQTGVVHFPKELVSMVL
jgi:hypothetical protein